MRRAAIIVVLCAATTATAGPRRILVLKSEGKISAAARGRIDAAVVSVARRAGGSVEPGDITFGDAQTAVGCTGDVAACKDAVIDTLGVDEIVAVSVAPAGGGTVKVQVRRATRGSAPREASATVPGASPDKDLAAGIGSLFEPAPAPNPVIPPPAPAPAEPAVSAAPDGAIAPPPPEGRRRSRLLPIIGVSTGAVLMGVGIVLWGYASSQQDEIDNFQVRNRDDYELLKELESTADSNALWGNVSFFAGLAVAGASGYLWFKRSRDHSVAITPTVVPGGGGIAITLGGGR